VDLEVKDNLDGLILKLQKMKQDANRRGKQWAEESALTLYKYLHEHLEKQGRDESFPPPLAAATRHIYEISGGSDGSGIRDHIEKGTNMSGSTFVAYVGIPQGEPTMVAKVQNDGAVIPVTEKMRGFLAATYGISLKKETTHIVIPARHFWDKSVKRAKEKAKKRAGEIMRGK
jgi:hypothetical protein